MQDFLSIQGICYEGIVAESLKTPASSYLHHTADPMSRCKPLADPCLPIPAFSVTLPVTPSSDCNMAQYDPSSPNDTTLHPPSQSSVSDDQSHDYTALIHDPPTATFAFPSP